MDLLITQRLKINQVQVPYQAILEQAAEDLLKSPSNNFRSEDDIEFIRKFYVMPDVKVAGLPEGQIRHLITTGDLDRDHEILAPKGMVSKYFKQNRMVLWSHNYMDPDNIMGKNISLTMTPLPAWEAITEFTLDEEKAAKVYRLYKGGFLKCWSVGFIPIKGHRPKPEDGGPDVEDNSWKLPEGVIRYIHDKWELLEYSAVCVPSNPNARTQEIAKQYDLDNILLKELNFSIEESQNKLKIPDGKTILDLGSIKKEVDNDNGEPEEKDKKTEKKEKDPEGKEEGSGEISPGEEFILWADYLCEDGLTKGCLICESMPDDLKQIIETDEIQTPDEIKEIAQWLCDRSYDDAEEIDDEIVTKPLPNTHACRVKDPKLFEKGSIRTMKKESDGKPYSILIGRLKGKKKTTTQGYRYPKEHWTAAAARAHCKSHDGIRFEAAKATDDLVITRELFEDMAQNIEDLRDTLKSGRTLSVKTRVHINDCIAALEEAAREINTTKRKLNSLLAVADEKPDLENPDDKKFYMLDRGQLADFEYLLHHIEADKDGNEEIHHCYLYDHIANMFEQGHLLVKDSEVFLDGKKVKSGLFHFLKRLEPKQDISWSDVEAKENKIPARKLRAGMSFEQKAKVWG